MGGYGGGERGSCSRRDLLYLRRLSEMVEFEWGLEMLADEGVE